MGGTSSSSQTSSSSLAPYNPASGSLNGILGSLGTMANGVGTSPNASETGTINTAVGNSNTLNAPIMSGALGLLNGGGATNNDSSILSNLSNLKNGIVGTTASGANIGNNTALQNELQAVNTNAENGVNSSFAAAGRSGSPGQGAAIGTAVANADAPIIASQYNTDTTNALNAANTLYGAGNTTYGMLNNTNATANANLGSGAALGSDALANNSAALTAEQNQFNIPASQYQTLLGMISPVAAQFGTQNGTQTGTQTMSPIQQFAMLGQGIGQMGSGLNNFGQFLWG